MMLDDSEEKELSAILAYKRLFNSPDGEIVLEHLKRISHYYTSTVNPLDTLDLSKWREGRRSVVIDILVNLKKDVEAYRNYLLEQKKAREENA